MFTITAERETNCIRISFDSLFWDLEIVEQFRLRRAAAVAELQCAPGTHLVLADLRNAIIQSQDTIQAAQAIIGTSVAAKIALVASNALARMQAKRLRIRDNVILFDDMEEAEDWLFEEREEPMAEGMRTAPPPAAVA